MSLYDNMPPYHYDTGDFEELRKAYDALEADFNIACSVLDSATTPAKWQGEILDEMINVVGYGDELPYLSGDEAKREFLFDYLSSMRLMTEEAFKKHVERAFGDATLVWFASGGTYTNGRNATDFEPQWEYYPTVLPKYTITINNSRNVYIKVDCSGVTAEYYTPDGVNTYTLAYDRLIGHISETFPIGFRLKLDVNMHPVGVDNEIFIGAVSNVTDAQISETGNKANIYPQTYVYRLLGADDPPSDNDVLTVDWTGTTNPLRYYVEGLWYDADDLESHGYSATRTGFHVPLTQTTVDQYVGSFSIPEGIDLSEPTYIAIRGGSYLRVRFTGTAPNKSTPGDWTWLKNIEPDLADAELVYSVAQHRTYYTGFTGTFLYVYIDTWTPVQFYSEPSSHSLPYTIDRQNRILYLSEWGVFRHTNPLELYGTSLIEPSNAIVFLDNNGEMTNYIKISRLDDMVTGGSESLGMVGGDVRIPDYEWYNYILVDTIYNDQSYRIKIYRDPSTNPDNPVIGWFNNQPDANHQYCFEYDPTTMVEDEYGRIVNFIPVEGGYVGIGSHGGWPIEQSDSVNACRSDRVRQPVTHTIDNTIHLVEV